MSNLEFVLRELNGRCDFLLVIEAGKEGGRTLGGKLRIFCSGHAELSGGRVEYKVLRQCCCSLVNSLGQDYGIRSK